MNAMTEKHPQSTLLSQHERCAIERYVDRFLFSVGELFESGEITTDDFDYPTRHRLEAILDIINNEKSHRQQKCQVLKPAV